MQSALSSDSKTIDIHHAGTAMRFLTAYLSTQEGREVTLTGSARMQERPIKVLVDALRELGADISYKKNEGFPPLLIKGKAITKHKVSIKANVSSQYISALLLIAPSLKNGIELTLEGDITSIPYIKMTLSLLEQLGVKTVFENKTITVEHAKSGISPITLTVESDWSSASYFYSIVALSDIGTAITLSSYKKKSLQGDSVLVDIYKAFGVETEFKSNAIVISKKTNCKQETVNCQLIKAPDIAQTIAVTCLGLGVNCHLEGLHTLKIKETDRLLALKNEIEKFGTPVSITNDSLSINQMKPLNDNITVETYKDHRMAMAFAPLALKVNLAINEAEVVSKSYPEFWRDLSQIGFIIKEK
jgi:3-phosphoshikimate 1-carboxyvinyltransferase